MTNTMEFNAGRFPNTAIFNNETNPKNMTFKEQIPRPQISNVQCTKVSDGTGCGSGLGTRYTTTWTNNAFVTNDHEVVVTLSGGTPSVAATQTLPLTLASVNVTSYEVNDNLTPFNPLTYTLTYELKEDGGTVLQSGNVTPSPTSAIFDIITSCTV